MMTNCDTQIFWNDEELGVEVKNAEHHFIINAFVETKMNRLNSSKFAATMAYWRIPNLDELKLIYANLNTINSIIYKNNGILIREGMHWVEYGNSCILLGTGDVYQSADVVENYMRLIK